MTETELKRRRRKMAGLWLVFSVVLFIPIHYEIGGIAMMLAAGGCAFIAGINLLFSFSGQNSIVDCSDISPDAQNRSIYSDKDEESLGKAARFDDGWQPKKKHR